jgi:hypothetical protein
MAVTINKPVYIKAGKISDSDKKKQGISPIIVPKVPGATGMRPAKNPVARKTNQFDLKFMTKVFIIRQYFCQEHDGKYHVMFI